MDEYLTLIFFLCIIMFIISGFDKMLNFNKSKKRLIKHLDSLDERSANLFIGATIVLEIVAPLIIMYCLVTKGKLKDQAVYSAYALALFTAVATFIFYFPPEGNKLYGFLGNTTTFGCMLLIAYYLKNNINDK